jgi:hypothetical protein
MVKEERWKARFAPRRKHMVTFNETDSVRASSIIIIIIIIIIINFNFNFERHTHASHHRQRSNQALLNI